MLFSEVILTTWPQIMRLIVIMKRRGDKWLARFGYLWRFCDLASCGEKNEARVGLFGLYRETRKVCEYFFRVFKTHRRAPLRGMERVLEKIEAGYVASFTVLNLKKPSIITREKN